MNSFSARTAAAATIVLDHTERQIFKLLLECVRHHDLPVTLRVAGGWVRDKLLGLSCHDIDIAIDAMMGRPFVDKLESYLNHRKNDRCDDGDNDQVPDSEATRGGVMASGIGTIKSNPDKSKHLETATMKLCGVHVDFVNLRNESYSLEYQGISASSPAPSVSSVLSSISSTTSSSKSRIPTKIAFGTPLEDAQRRDITINALFYNLHTAQVEDFVGLGINDLLTAKVIRTPLDPLTTLMDDPLRLLRVIRFASRFNYKIVPELLRALHHELVHQAFREKVSRERVGIEIDKMLSAGNANTVALGMEYLLHERIYPLLFVDVGEYSEMKLVDPDKLLVEFSSCSFSADKRTTAYCYLFLPLASKHGKSVGSKVSKAMRDGLKLSAVDYELIGRIVDGLLYIQEANLNNPVSIGRVIRSIGQHWRLSCFLLNSYSKLFSIGSNGSMADGFVTAAGKFELLTCHEMRPLLSGKDVMDVFGVKEGKQIGEILNVALDLQLTDPDIQKDALISQLQSHLLNNKFE